MIGFASESLSGQISDFGALVGLVLALVTVLTANRSASVGTLEDDASTLSERQKWTEFFLDGILATFTSLVWLSGLKLAVEAVAKWHPLGEAGPLEGVFAVTWVLLLGLIGWQAALMVRSFRLSTS